MSRSLRRKRSGTITRRNTSSRVNVLRTTFATLRSRRGSQSESSRSMFWQRLTDKRSADVLLRNRYPKLESLLSHKHALTESARYSIPPTYLDPPLSNLPVLPESESPSSSVEPPPPSSATAQAISQLVSSSARFDAILLTPPPSTTFAELSSLPLSSLASNPGFIWLWVGSGQKTFDPVTGELAGTDGGIGLEQGRELLSSWGYRRCEDIVWLKTNRENPQGDFEREVKSLFSPTIEHCLMGIRGTVRRSNDSWFVHCNVDTDVIVWEGDQEG